MMVWQSWQRSLLAVSGLFLVAGLASAQQLPPGPDPRGEPRQFHAGRSASYAVWHGPLGWQLRTTTAGKRHHFHGTIQVVDGTFLEVNGILLEKLGPNHDQWHLAPGNQTLTFEFNTEEGVDGMHFWLSKGAKTLIFQLYMDGAGVPEQIFIGRAGHHPPAPAFYLPAHP
jgi:hypothetical protein